MGYREVIIGDRPTSYWRLGEVQPAAPVIVQTAPTGHTTSGTTVTATLSNTPSSANMLIAVCCGYLGTGFTGSTLSWTQDTEGTNNAGVAILSAVSDGSTKAFTFTNTGGTTQENWVVLMEVSGLIASPKDHAATLFTTTGTSWSASMAANTNPNTLEIFAIGLDTYDADPSATSFSNGFTKTNCLSTNVSGTAISMLVGTKIVSQQDTPSSSVAWTTTAFAVGIGVSYKGLPSPAAYDQMNGLNNLTPSGGVISAGGAAVVGSDGAKHFDGSTGFLGIASPSGMVTGSAAGSMEAWINPDVALSTTGAGGPVVCFGKTSNTNGGRVMLCQNISGTYYVFTDGVNGGNNATPPSASYPIPGRWNHMVLTFDGAGHLYLYMNGFLAQIASGVTQANVTLNTDASQALHIGSRQDTTGNFAGSIDEVAVYNYQLTSEQVYAHWIAGHTAGPADRRRRGR